MAISEQAQQMKDELFAHLIRLNTAVYARIGAEQLHMRQPKAATEICMSMGVLTQELLGLVRRARTARECINVCRTIGKVLRETADEFETIEAKARS
jgi:hypothetical protein